MTKPKWTSVILAVAALLWISPPQKLSARENITKGDAAVLKRGAKLHIKHREWDLAIVALEKSLKGAPNDLEVRVLLGELYHEKSLPDKMKAEFDYVLSTKRGKRKYKKRIDPFLETWYDRHFNTGLKAFRVEDWAGAVEALQKSRNLMPDRIVAYKALGVAYLNMGQTQAGIDSYLKVIELDENDAVGYATLGKAYVNTDQVEEAKKCFAKAHELEPEKIDHLKALASVQVRLGNREGALEAAEKALAIDPTRTNIRDMAARIYMEGENYAKACKLLESVVEAEPDNLPATYNLAFCYKRLEKFDQAEKLFLRSVQADSKDFEGWYQLGLVYDSTGKLPAAIEAFQMVVSLKPANENAWVALAKSYARISQTQSGKQASESAKKAEEAFNMSQSLASQGDQE